MDERLIEVYGSLATDQYGQDIYFYIGLITKAAQPPQKRFSYIQGIRLLPFTRTFKSCS